MNSISAKDNKSDPLRYVTPEEFNTQTTVMSFEGTCHCGMTYGFITSNENIFIDFRCIKCDNNIQSQLTKFVGD